jgi:hypothetical protein
MTVTEAKALNRLLNWLLGLPNIHGEEVPEIQAKENAIALAVAAEKAWPEGLSPDRVAGRWDDRPTGVKP